VLSGIADEFPDTNLHGSEIFVAGLAFAAARQPAVNFVQVDARNIPFVNEFDVIGAFDVLEHVKEDSEVLSQMYQATRKRGGTASSGSSNSNAFRIAGGSDRSTKPSWSRAMAARSSWWFRARPETGGFITLPSGICATR